MSRYFIYGGYIWLAWMLGVIFYPLPAQDLGMLTLKKEGIKLEGGLHVSLDHYQAQNGMNRSIPLRYSIMGNPTLSIFGVQLPFSLYFSSYSQGLDHPFNQFGISPYYKWARLYLGYNNLFLSEYTLNGLTFNGVGAELTPGKFRITGLYGKFRNYVYIPNDDIEKTSLIPSYQRKGAGIKVGVGSDKSFIDLIYLNIKDEVEDIPQLLSDSIQVYPQDNLLFGLNTGVTIFKRLQFFINSAASILTANKKLEEFQLDKSEIEFLTDLVEPNQSTRVSFAGDCGLTLRFNYVNLGIKYQRIEPNFVSLGSNYYPEDTENYTFNTNVSFLKGKGSIQGNFGIGKNNLRNTRIRSNNRLIGSLGGNLIFSKSVNMNFSYSNFRMNQSSQILDIRDTLKYIQTNSHAYLSTNILKINTSLQRNISITASTSSYSSESGDMQLGEGTTINGGVLYGLAFLNKDLSLSSSLQFSRFEIGETNDINRLNYGITVGKGLWKKKINTNASVQFSHEIGGNNSVGNHLVIRSGASFLLAQKHNFSVIVSYLKREIKEQKDFSEFRTGLAYNFNF